MDILQCLQKYGQRLDSEIAEETGVALARVRERFALLTGTGEVITCKLTWAMSRTLDTKLAMDALNMAIAHRGPPVTLHSDQGSTYATGSYREIVNHHGIRQSMSRKGDCWDTQSKIALNVRPSLTRAGIGPLPLR
jgi:transposase InsO family protein